MITPVAEVLLAALVLGATSLVARLVVWLPNRALPAVLPWLQSMAVGLLVGDALLHVLPHALESGQPVDTLMAAFAVGVVALVGVEGWIRSRRQAPALLTTPHPASFARMNLAGDFLHHLVDGVIVASAFMAGQATGIAVMLAIAAHEIPRELSSASVLVAGGYPPRRAFWLSVMMAGAVPVGALAMHLLPLSPAGLAMVLAGAAGCVLYVALADILPGVWARAALVHRRAPAIGVLTGLAVMWVAALAEHG